MNDDVFIEQIYATIMSIWWSGAGAKVTMYGVEHTDDNHIALAEYAAKYHTDHIWRELKPLVEREIEDAAQAYAARLLALSSGQRAAKRAQQTRDLRK